MASLEEIYALIGSAARGQLSYADLDSGIGFAFYELPVDVVRSEPAAFASEVIERMEFVRSRPTPEELEMGFLSPEEFMTWLRRSWPMQTNKAGLGDRAA